MKILNTFFRLNQLNDIKNLDLTSGKNKYFKSIQNHLDTLSVIKTIEFFYKIQVKNIGLIEHAFKIRIIVEILNV